MSELTPRAASICVDFGTSHTVVTLRRDDGRIHQLLFDGSPQLPSAVFMDDAGNPVVGADAVHGGRRRPERFEPNPKRRIDDGTLLLGGQELPVVSVIGAVLSRVARECEQTLGGLGPVTVTVPAAWGPTRRHVVADAAAAAGLGRVALVAEPIAAASYFVEVLGNDVPVGSGVVVYDLGGGTFDATVLRRTPAGFEVLAVDGADDLGGLDFDQALAEHLAASVRAEDERWRRLTAPENTADLRHRVAFLEEIRLAKERLSRSTSTDLLIPLLDVDIHLTREELQTVAAPLLGRTVRITQGAIREAGLVKEHTAGLFLVGAASRMPLVATMLHRELGIAPATIEQPELAVSEGGLTAQAVISSPPRPAAMGTPDAILTATPPQGPPAAQSPPGGPPTQPTGPVHTSPGPAPVPVAPGARPSGPWITTRKGLATLVASGLAVALALVLVIANLPDRNGADPDDPPTEAAQATGSSEESQSTEEFDTGSELLREAQNGGTIRIAYVQEYPYSYNVADGQVTGQSVETHRYLLAQLGIAEDQIKWVLTDWGNLIPDLGSTHDMVVAGMYINPHRCSDVSFTEPDYVMPDSLLVLDGNPLGLTDIDSIAAHDSAMIGVMNGTEEHRIAEELGIADDRFNIQADLDALVLELKAGRIDAIALTSINLRQEAADDDELEVTEGYPLTDPSTGEPIIGAGATAFQPADADFRDAMNEELAKLQEDPDQWQGLVGEFGFTVKENFPPSDVTAEDLCGGNYQ